MRLRVILLISIGVNVALAALMVYWLRFAARQELNPVTFTEPAPAFIKAAKTNVVVRRLNFSWEDVESEDYPTYIKNLRDIGCPEATIRDIIVAEVNQLYAKRQAFEIVSPEHQWWRSDPDPTVELAAAKKLQALEQERGELLTRLLGPDWDNSADRMLGRTTLTGPELGTMPRATKKAVQEINEQARQRIQTYLESVGKEGKLVDPVAVARLRQQTRADLARILTPEQLEEYLLRYSQNAADLRNELRGQDLTPEEFRAIFRARDPIEQQVQLDTGEKQDTVSVRQRQELEQQRDAAIKNVLGPERYQALVLNKDPLYREAKTALEKLGTPRDKIMPIYEINQVSEAERQRIRNDSKLSADEKIEALKTVQEAQQKSLLKILGEEAFHLYEQETGK